MRYSLRQWIFWVLGTAMLGLVSALVRRRRLSNEFPFFSTYIYFHFVYAIAERILGLRLDPIASWYVYWLREVMDIFLILGVVHELFTKALEPYPTLQKVGSRLYVSGAVVLSVIALWMAMSYHYTIVARVENGLQNMVRGLHFVEISLVFLLFVFSRVFGLSWRHYLFGIALGFGVKSCLQVLAQSLWLQRGYPGTLVANIFAQVAFLSGMGIWSYFLATEESRAAELTAMESPQLARWDSALEVLLAR